MKYMTSQKKTILDYLILHKEHHYSVEELIDALASDGTKLPKSTVYRQIAQLLDDGVLRRFEAPGEKSFVYQYAAGVDCEHHFHLKCTRCGRLIHMECVELEAVRRHIQEEHGFLIGGSSIIYGICSDCTAETEREKRSKK